MDTLDVILKRDRQVVLAALLLVTLLTWGYVLLGAGMGMRAFEMTTMSSHVRVGGVADLDADASGTGSMAGRMTAMSMPSGWTPGYALLMFWMWWAMMIAMMLPSASPMILLFTRVNRKQQQSGAPFVSAGIFALGYLAVWGVFSLLAVGAQWALQASGLVSAILTSTSLALNAGLLIAAGLWQLTPLKHACLNHCRGPLHFLVHGFRPGRWGALRMGVTHGAYCVGCCWFLMGLLFVGGVMNLYWIGGLALYVLIEKVAPAGHGLGIAVGTILVGWGAWLLVSMA